MRRHVFLMPVLVLLLASVTVGIASAQSPLNHLNVYGYFATRFEKTFSEPSLEDGRIVKETAVGEWTNPSLNVMMQHQLDNQFKAFVNLNGSGGDQIDVRNFWGEYSASRRLNLRLGKVYRKFGLYNELLDAVPTYYGIEPPELFDSDHLIVSRTTTLMLHGATDAGSGVVAYSLSTDNGEGGAIKNAFPMGYDVRYKSGTGLLTVGTSGYRSNGPAAPDLAVGDGSPKSGVLPWMSSDDFWVAGGFSEVNYKSWTFQSEYWHANHNAVRNPDATAEMVNSAHPNSAQISRFTSAPIQGEAKGEDISPNGDYQVDTWYFRAGYSVDSKVGEFGPYMQYDFYKNPETIAKKTYGGDNEAGIADNGEFVKWTIGLLLRPVPQVAMKLDGSQHRYILGGRNVSYPEMRFDVSYIF